jgi:hypothetical protein
VVPCIWTLVAIEGRISELASDPPIPDRSRKRVRFAGRPGLEILALASSTTPAVAFRQHNAVKEEKKIDLFFFFFFFG